MKTSNSGYFIPVCCALNLKFISIIDDNLTVIIKKTTAMFGFKKHTEILKLPYENTPLSKSINTRGPRTALTVTCIS